MSASPPRQLAIVKQAEGNSNSSYCFTISLLGSTQLNLPSQYSLLLNKTFLLQHRQAHSCTVRLFHKYTLFTKTLKSAFICFREQNQTLNHCAYISISCLLKPQQCLSLYKNNYQRMVINLKIKRNVFFLLPKCIGQVGHCATTAAVLIPKQR